MGIVIDTLRGEGGGSLSLVIYLAMGWLILFALDPIIAVLPPAGFRLLVAGGLFYTVGVTFYVLANVWPWCHGIVQPGPRGIPRSEGMPCRVR